MITPVFAQEIDFLPEGVILTKYKYISTSLDSELDGSEKKPLLEALLHRSSISKDSINGDLSYRTSVHTFQFQYGLYDNLNLGFILPFINKQRESSLTVTDAGNTEQTQFVDRYESAESQGLGDVSLVLSWRPHYSDSSDFRLIFELNGNNGDFYVADSDNVSLGNGANDLGFYLRWIVYSNSSNFNTDIEVGIIATENTTWSEKGNNYDIEKGNDVSLRMDFSTTSGAWNYGGGLKAISTGETHVNGLEQNDNYLAYTCKLFVNIGNMNQLETSTVNLPWSAGMYLENTIFGASAPANSSIGLKAAFYF